MRHESVGAHFVNLGASALAAKSVPEAIEVCGLEIPIGIFEPPKRIGGRDIAAQQRERESAERWSADTPEGAACLRNALYN